MSPFRYPATVKIYTLAQSLAVKTFGRVNQATLDHLHKLLQELVAEGS